MHESVFVTAELRQRFRMAWNESRVLFFSAPCGCGKTAQTRLLLRGKSVVAVHASDAPIEPEEISPDCDVLLVDDLPQMKDARAQQALCDLIRQRTELHFVLLSRGVLPGWLMPFQFAGSLTAFSMEQLMLDQVTAQKVLEASGILPDEQEMHQIQQDLGGYPVALQLLSRCMQGRKYSAEVFTDVKRDLFRYYDEAVFRRFAPPLRSLLMELAPFDSFDADMAKMVSGDADAGRWMETVLRDTTMLQFDGLDTYHFHTIFRYFLQWEARQKMTPAEQRALYSRAALYYELHDQLPRALDCYAQAGEQHKVSELLEKNAELHPGVGHYHEMEKYYFALPREEILRSPSLMCGMSMLTAMCLDYSASEEWYAELQRYAVQLKMTDAEFKEVRGKLAYLDIALPQRGSKGLIDVIANVFHVMTEKGMKVPSFSVTSTLPSVMNGGKDFCEWSKKDDLLYATMRRTVETVLGRDGIGLADCSLCESKFEKGEDISTRMLDLMGRLGEIQTRGTPDIEFAVIGLLARMQAAQGRFAAALDLLQNLRAKFADSGETRFLPNLDAAICRIRLHMGDRESVTAWLRDCAPRDTVRMRALWRYQYLTQAMVQITTGDYTGALLILARLMPYCEHCGRVMDGIYIRILMALCHYRMREDVWKEEFCAALDTCCAYRFVQPVAQYGAAVLPLLQECSWRGDRSWLQRVVAAVRVQAVLDPDYLSCEAQLKDPLSGAEKQVLRLLCRNKSNNEIGEILDIRLPTVKSHVSHILQKLGVSRRSEAKQVAENLHLI